MTGHHHFCSSSRVVGMALSLPPPSLPARSGSQWLVGQNVPSIGRGGAEGQRSVGLQAFEILNNNKRNLQLIPSKRIRDIAQWLQDVGVHIPEWSATGLVAGLGGLPLTTIKGVVSGKRCEPVQRFRDPPRVAAPKKDANKGLSHSGVATTRALSGGCQRPGPKGPFHACTGPTCGSLPLTQSPS